MSQTTRRQVAEKDRFPREGPEPPLHRDPGRPRWSRTPWPPRGSRYNRSIYTPFVTLCTFLSQVLDPDHSCRAAVARVHRLAGHPRPRALLGADRHLLRCATAAPPGGRQTPGPPHRPRGRGRRRGRLAVEGAAGAAGRRHHRVDARHAPQPGGLPPAELRRPRGWGSRWSGWWRSSRWPPGSCSTWRPARTRGRRRVRRRCSARCGTGSSPAGSCWGTASSPRSSASSASPSGASTGCSGCTSGGSTTSAAAGGWGSRIMW